MVVKDQPKVFFVLVNYNGVKDTIECINSINTVLSYKNYQIIVVDNSPNVDSFNKLKNEDLENTIILRSETNNGFAAGCNLGIKEAYKYGYDYVILLNNDTIVKSADLVEQLLLCFETQNKVGISGGKILYYNFPKDCWYAAGYLTPIRLRAKNRVNVRGIQETSFITGCLQMISKEAVDKVGLMTEDYFLCYEDADYCERMRKAGYKTVYNSNAQIYHKVSKSAPKSSPVSIYNSNRARYLYMRRFHKNNFIALLDYKIELFIKKICYRNEKRYAIINVIKEINELNKDKKF